MNWELRVDFLLVNGNVLILSLNGENNGKSGNEPLLYYSHLKQEISIIVRFSSVITAGATNMRLESRVGFRKFRFWTLFTYHPLQAKQSNGMQFFGQCVFSKNSLDYLSLLKVKGGVSYTASRQMALGIIPNNILPFHRV